MHAHPQPSAPEQQFWLADTGATTHMTSELANLELAAPYKGTDTITTASGTGLTISYIGTSRLPVSNTTLALKNVLHVPQISQHLLSIYQLCKDNRCRFICDDTCFWVQDKSTGTILKGLCREGYYPIPFNIPEKLSSALPHKHIPCLAKPVNTHLWHKRLGHSSNVITSAILHQNKIPTSLDPCRSICTPCLEGKFTKLQFNSHVAKSVQPLEVLHNDV
ncbi:hypothetical protein ACFX1R_014988 [Malus domestica]